MVPSALWSYYFNDLDFFQIIYASIITILSGLIIYCTTYFNLKKNNKNDLSLKDGFKFGKSALICFGLSDLYIFTKNI